MYVYDIRVYVYKSRSTIFRNLIFGKPISKYILLFYTCNYYRFILRIEINDNECYLIVT